MPNPYPKPPEQDELSPYSSVINNALNAEKCSCSGMRPENRTVRATDLRYGNRNALNTGKTLRIEFRSEAPRGSCRAAVTSHWVVCGIFKGASGVRLLTGK